MFIFKYSSTPNVTLTQKRAGGEIIFKKINQKVTKEHRKKSSQNQTNVLGLLASFIIFQFTYHIIIA